MIGAEPSSKTPPVGSRAPRLLAISDRRLLAGRALADWLAELAEAGVDAVQIREKDLTDRELADLASRVRDAAPGLRLLINGRLDIALATGCDGAHLPTSGLPVAALRARFGAAPLLGRSTHHPAEVEEARRAGADYVTFGPVWDTPSKRAYGPPPGLDGLRRASRYGLSVLALGGVDGARLEMAAAAGASGMAGIRVFHQSAALAELAASARRLGWIRRGIDGDIDSGWKG